MRTTLLKWMLGAVVVAMMPGCDKGENHILEGRKSVSAGQYQEAIKHFDEALKADSNSYTAMWGKADAYRRDNNLAKQAEMLESIASQKGLMEKFAGVVKPALETNYRQQAQGLADKDLKKEEFLRKALKQNKKSEASGTLANLLSKKGTALMGKGEYAEAGKVLKEASKLRISRKQRRQLKGRIEIADFKAFTKGFEPRFAKVKADLIKEKIYDEKTQTFFIEATAELEGDPKDENFEKDASSAGLVAVTNALNVLTWRVGSLEYPVGARVSYSAAVVSVVKKELLEKPTRKKPGKYFFRISVPADAVFEQVAKIDKGEFKAPPPPPVDPAAAGSAAAGSAPSAAPVPKKKKKKGK